MNRLLRFLFILLITAMSGAIIFQLFFPSYMGSHSGYGVSIGWQREIGIWNVAVPVSYTHLTMMRSTPSASGISVAKRTFGFPISITEAMFWTPASFARLIYPSNSSLASVWNPSYTSASKLETLCTVSYTHLELVHVKPLEVGQTVGYGATYQTSDEEWIGTIPIGYADGWTRDMQGFHVLVDGQFCPIVGRVSMDQITIRLPKAYPIGTKVVLIGVDGEMCIRDRV